MTPRALTIAGMDPIGGAGVLQDARTFAACGVWPLAAVTALTVQDTSRIHRWEAVTAELLREQIEVVVRDASPGATKTGMLAGAAIAEVVAEAARELPLGPLVVDPVLRASSGDALAAADLAAAIATHLLPLAAIVTPNLAEAAALTGSAPPATIAEMREAARALVARGARAALVTGGHLDDGDATDVLLDDRGELHELTAPRIATHDDHGTGCVLSAAIAAHLARGAQLIDAVRAAKGVVTRALRNAERFGAGRGPVYPVAEARPWPLAGHPFE